jgi:hypothetical protein
MSAPPQILKSAHAAKVQLRDISADLDVMIDYPHKADVANGVDDRFDKLPAPLLRDVMASVNQRCTAICTKKYIYCWKIVQGEWMICYK